MEAMVAKELPTVAKDQIACWLSETAGSDEAGVQTATSHLEGAQTAPKFALCLLKLAAGDREKGVRVAAATYLKNFLKAHWNAEPGAMSCEEKLEFRNQLVNELLRVDGLVLKLLAEAFRLVTLHDFAKQKTWPELVPTLKLAVENIDMANVSEASSDMKTLNCLLGLQTITKPFQYFLNPTMAHEPVPENLELIAKELLVPLQGLFHQLVQQVATSKAQGYAQHDAILLIFCKSIDLALKSHMPSALLESFDVWFADILSLLDSVVLVEKIVTLEQEPRVKIWKRTLQICCSLVSRHRIHVDKFIPSLTDAALAITGQGACAKNLNPMQQRVVSLGFDLVSNILQTEVGWKLIAPHFPSLLDKAIFPALMMNDKNLTEWVEEEDEYVQKNLPSDLDEATGWTEDLLLPRQSALNLLAIISMAKGSPSVRRRRKAGSQAKRRKVGAKGKDKDCSDRAGDMLVMPYLSQFPLPADGADLQSIEVLRYYGVMIAYGGLQRYLKTQPAAKITMLLEKRVFPLYLMVAPSPYVLANANWMLGELVSCLPEELCENVYTALLKALVAPNAGTNSWWPVRASAAAALASLLRVGKVHMDDYKPIHWLPLLQATVAGVRMHDEREASMALQLLSTVAVAGGESVAPHVPAITAVVQVEMCKHIPPHPQPWPQVVELGFSAIAALARSWNSAAPDEAEDRGKVFLKWKVASAPVACKHAELLQQAWLAPLHEAGALPARPSPSCLSDASVLLAAILRHTQSMAEVVALRLEPLLRVWGNLVAEWNAWEEREDEAVFDCIDELIALQERCSIIQFSLTELTTPPHRSILDCVVTFLISAIDSAYASACWRACRNGHAILHATQFALEGEALTATLIPRFCEAAARRLLQLSSTTVPLAKPLVLMVAVGFISLPEQVERILCLEGEDGGSQGVVAFAEALAWLAESEADPGLALESELKIAVIGLQRLMVHIIDKDLLQNQKAFSVAHHCMRSLLEAMVDLKDIMESSESDRSGSSSSSNSDSGSGFSDDEEDESMNDSASDVSDAAHEETEEEFLERYAQAARDLQAEACEEAENGQDEDGHELALGVLGLVDFEKQVLTFVKEHGKKLSTRQAFSRILLARFRNQYPKARGYL